MATQLEQIENNFKYHPLTVEQKHRYELLRNVARDLALNFIDNCPQSRELSLALTKLEESVMWANAAIARNHPQNPIPPVEIKG